jgi:hypothetical protein
MSDDNPTISTHPSFFPKWKDKIFEIRNGNGWVLMRQMSSFERRVLRSLLFATQRDEKAVKLVCL